MGQITRMDGKGWIPRKIHSQWDIQLFIYLLINLYLFIYLFICLCIYLYNYNIYNCLLSFCIILYTIIYYIYTYIHILYDEMDLDGIYNVVNRRFLRMEVPQ